LGGRHHAQQRVGNGSKYEYSASAPFWSGHGSMQSPLGLGLHGASEMSPYAVTDFTMMVEDEGQPVHDFTQLSSTGRLQDLNVADNSTWHRQYPEFVFLQKQTEEWTKKQQKVLVCDASIKVMTETRPNAHLSIAFDLHSQRDLRSYESLVCTTRFYDDGKMDAEPQFDGPHNHDLKEHRTSCEYTPDPHGCSGRLRLAFGSRFWVNRMSKYQSLRHKDENLVGRSLMKLTATQDVYGVKPNGEAECVLTILWRFRQTRDSAEVGAMKWRAVSFGAPQSGLKQEWSEPSPVDDMSEELIDIAPSQSQHQHPSNTLYHQPSSLNQQLLHQAYAVQPYHAQPPQLHIDTLTTWPCSAPDLDQPSASAAPSTATDHSFASIPNLSHSQDTASGFDANDFDFTGGRIDISGAFSPAIMAQYDAYPASQSNDLSSLNALAGLDHQSLLDMGLNPNDIAQIGVSNSASMQDPNLSQVQSYHSTKPVPSWNHNAALISSLENAAETYHSPWTRQQQHHHQQQQNHAHVHHHQHHHQHQQQQHHSQHHPLPTYPSDDLIGHPSLHSSSANLSSGTLWNLASPFHEDTSSGAVNLASMVGVGIGAGVGVGVNGMERKDSMQAGNGGLNLGVGVLGMIERDQRARGY
jgi:transcriptional enhancer factor